MIRRPPRSTHCISSAASDVYKRQTWGYQCTCNSYALLLTTGQFIRHMMRPIFQAQFIQIFHCKNISFLTTHILIKKWQCNILHCIFERNQIKRLKNKANHPVTILGSTGFTQFFHQNIIEIIIPRIIIIQNTQNIKQG
eukprot:TRINITY_DN962_c0_g1_i2.p2 TRINITY_DN962_c0_g1~~TRINITY_DN962_c0_g1_i2.p2  ORF type:complete len:139 (+),score=15.74 TRINITY_DN962_c0_g1_i2:123-539(+)